MCLNGAPPASMMMQTAQLPQVHRAQVPGKYSAVMEARTRK